MVTIYWYKTRVYLCTENELIDTYFYIKLRLIEQDYSQFPQIAEVLFHSSYTG